MATNAIKVKNLVKRYKSAKENAVDNVSFEVEQGEFFAFLGPNGAGKTTTISVLTTTLAKTEGKVIIAGYDLDSDAQKIRKNIGVIFQNPSLDKNLSAEENVRLHAVLYQLYPFRPTFSMMPKAYKTKVTKLADLLGIRKDLGKPIKSFSGGMKRKLEILRSLMHNPKVLFLDEPTSGLDPESRKNVWQYLSEVRKTTNMTILLTTHYLEEAEEADHIAIINKGKIVTFGSPSEIKHELTLSYLVVDADNRTKLLSELKKHKLQHEVTGRVKVFYGKKNPQEVIQAIKTKLSYLDIHNPSLEEAYLDVLEKQNSNNV